METEERAAALDHVFPGSAGKNNGKGPQWPPNAHVWTLKLISPRRHSLGKGLWMVSQVVLTEPLALILITRGPAGLHSPPGPTRPHLLLTNVFPPTRHPGRHSISKETFAGRPAWMERCTPHHRRVSRGVSGGGRGG